jgi:hypothetical protein
MLTEAKDTSELMVDLAYAALYFGDPDMAEEVDELNEDLTPSTSPASSPTASASPASWSPTSPTPRRSPTGCWCGTVPTWPTGR